MALGGFLGNFVLTVADHAQNGFFRPEEWVAVVAAAAAVGGLCAALSVPANRPLLVLVGFIMIVQVGVGVFGFLLHVLANLRAPLGTLWERFLYGAPAFAPLLFADLAILGLLALAALSHASTSVAAPISESQETARASTAI